ncbi:MAG: IS4 family transposase, partial [Bacteroidaceae bacterium]|nr:IS4 family transposase [Bacteroidaceae bacterium]
IGALFRETCSGAMELTIVERIWGAVLEMVIAMANVFNLEEEDIYDAIINQSDELAHIYDIYRLKLAV